MDNEYRLTVKQIVTRIISVIACGAGASGCVYSLTMQIAEAGALMTSLMWFAGLAAVVASIAGYVVTCDPGRGKGYVPAAVVCILAICVVCVVLERIYLYDFLVVVIGLAAMLVEAVVLVVYHYLLKAADPDAL